MRLSVPANTAPDRLPRGLVALFALTTGVAVANIYYVQPLLDVIGRTFGVDDGTAGLLVALGQVGYLIGVALLVPLGDLLERRGLITACLVLAAMASGACAAAPGFVVLAAAMVPLGVLSAVAQIVIPLASSMAGPRERGQVVGIAMSGLLIGVLGARTVSGLVAEIAGWRGPYVLAALFLLALAALLRRALPLVPPPAAPASYRSTLRSVFSLVGEEPVLRQRMAIAVMNFCSFAGLWTALTFLLSEAPFDYSEGLIGLFGLAGIAGAAIAPVSGRLADRGHVRLALTVFLLLLVGSWGVLALGRSSVVLLVIGIVIMDLATQGIQINSQSTIYALRPEARSRLTTAYMVAGFSGMVLGSVLAAFAYEHGGWYAVCAVTGGASLLALAIWASTQGAGRGRPLPEELPEPDSVPGCAVLSGALAGAVGDQLGLAALGEGDLDDVEVARSDGRLEDPARLLQHLADVVAGGDVDEGQHLHVRLGGDGGCLADGRVAGFGGPLRPLPRRRRSRGPAARRRQRPRPCSARRGVAGDHDGAAGAAGTHHLARAHRALRTLDLVPALQRREGRALANARRLRGGRVEAAGALVLDQRVAAGAHAVRGLEGLDLVVVVPTASPGASSSSSSSKPSRPISGASSLNKSRNPLGPWILSGAVRSVRS